MSLHPYTNSGKEKLQPGARGNMFQNDGIPGYRTNEDRINRTNTTLNLNEHDVLNIKYGLDPRLPELFRYGWAYGYNQIVVPKGRIVAVDPYLNVLDTDTLHYFNTMTLANGGKNVKISANGKDWEATDEAMTPDTITGYMKDKDGRVSNTLRAANTPIGIIERNEYTRDEGAYNGMMPGPVRTDALVELPVFSEKSKAEKNPWGSIYGEFKPGDLVKSDENGRVVKSPLSNPATCPDNIAEYERERQQIIGTVYSTDFSLMPEGSARFAQWALEDRMKFDDFNPYIKPNSNRRNEDVVSNPPTMYQSNYQYPGHPYDKGLFYNDLHMLASSRQGLYNPRFDMKHRLDQGIPALTDGYNAVVQNYGYTDNNDIASEPTMHIGNINRCTTLSGHEIMFTLPDTNLEAATIKVGTEKITITKREDGTFDISGTVIDKFTLNYSDLHKGLFSLVQTTVADSMETLQVVVGYTKRGMAGVPTNLDWDGCLGTAKILLQK